MYSIYIKDTDIYFEIQDFSEERKEISWFTVQLAKASSIGAGQKLGTSSFFQVAQMGGSGPRNRPSPSGISMSLTGSRTGN